MLQTFTLFWLFIAGSISAPVTQTEIESSAKSDDQVVGTLGHGGGGCPGGICDTEDG